MRRLPTKVVTLRSRSAWRFHPLAALLCFTLTSCGDYGPDLKVELARTLSAKWQVGSLQLDEWEITHREPRQWQYRFTAKVTSAEDLYENLGTLNDTLVLQPTVKKGVEKTLTGSAQARLDQMQWRSHFAFDQTEGLDGEPANAYGKNIFIVGISQKKDFIAAASKALQQSEAQLAKEEALIAERGSKWQADDSTFRDRVQQAENNLQAEQQLLRQEQVNIDSTVSRRVQAADMALLADMRAQQDKAKKELDVRYDALAQAYRTKTQGVQQQYQELRRQVLSREEYADKYRQLRDQEQATQKQYSDQRDQAWETYSVRLKGLQQAFDASRARLRDDITNSVKADMEKSGTALQEKSQLQQDALIASRNDLSQQRNALDRLSTEVSARKAQLERERALIKRLEQDQ